VSLDAESEENTSGAPLPKAKNVTPYKRVKVLIAILSYVFKRYS
jgi:hypothetical protein